MGGTAGEELAVRAGAGACSDPLEVYHLVQVRLAAFPAGSVPLPTLENYDHITIEREAEDTALLKTKHKADSSSPTTRNKLEPPTSPHGERTQRDGVRC